ncbi:hypothetical protein K1719_000308 [Acacia pycnantha]|nr:hypothetical protein K1719_000308 [Acacia pycnantha]
MAPETRSADQIHDIEQRIELLKKKQRIEQNSADIGDMQNSIARIEAYLTELVAKITTAPSKVGHHQGEVLRAVDDTPVDH